MIVIDCSAAMGMVRKTPEGNALSDLALDGETAIAPDVFYAELGNALWECVRSGDLGRSQIREAMEAAIGLVDRIYSSKDILAEAILEAARLDHPVYDMLYFVLARREGATLFTLDRKLQNLCLDNGVNCVFLDKDF